MPSSFGPLCLCGLLLLSSGAARASAQRPARPAEQVAPRTPGYVPPRTPWGDPDLQGIWPSIDVVRVPIERPRQYGTRILMSVDEQRELEKRENERIDRV